MNPRHFNPKKKITNRYVAEQPERLPVILEEYSNSTFREVTLRAPVVEAIIRIPEGEVRKIVLAHILNSTEYKVSGYVAERIELSTEDGYNIIFVKAVTDSDASCDFVKSLSKGIKIPSGDDDDDDDDDS